MAVYVQDRVGPVTEEEEKEKGGMRRCQGVEGRWKEDRKDRQSPLLIPEQRIPTDYSCNTLLLMHDFVHLHSYYSVGYLCRPLRMRGARSKQRLPTWRPAAKSSDLLAVLQNE